VRAAIQKQRLMFQAPISMCWCCANDVASLSPLLVPNCVRDRFKREQHGWGNLNIVFNTDGPLEAALRKEWIKGVKKQRW
jgi:hypothetical protein